MKKAVYALLLPLFLTLGAPSNAQDGPILSIEFLHHMDINGEQSTAKGTGWGHVTEGVMVIDFEISNYIDGYSGWATSLITNAGGGGGPVVGITANGAPSPFYSYLAEVGSWNFLKTTNDDYAKLETRFSLSLEGNVFVIEAATSGEARYPEIVGMGPEPVVYEFPQSRAAISTTTKTLVTAEGGAVKANVRLNYGTGLALSALAGSTRTMQVKVLSGGPRSERVKLMYYNALN